MPNPLLHSRMMGRHAQSAQEIGFRFHATGKAASFAVGEIIRAVLIRATSWLSGMAKSAISRGGIGQDTEILNELVDLVDRPVAPMLVVRVETDWYAHQSEFRYVLQPGEGLPGTVIPYPIEDVNPFIVRDFSRCILCGRCVQACNEVQVNQAIHFGYRGAATKIIAAGDRPYINSDCVFCGECVQACPVGALVEKDARYEARPWETQKVRTTCSYCGVGCQIYLHVKNNRVVKASGVEDVAPNFGSLCVKGRFGFDFIHSADRLKTPLIKENGTFREASWDEALDLVARKLGEIKAEYGADTIGFLTSARITNEENYIAQKFARAVVQTNNVDHCARL